MSVFTSVSQTELKSFLQPYDLGELVSFAGITAGIENTNYRVHTEKAALILTLFEQSESEDIRFCLDLMDYFADGNLPCARPYAAQGREFLTSLNGKPAVLVEQLPGASKTHPNLAQCAAIGAAMGAMHQLGGRYTHRRENERGIAWLRETARRITPLLEPVDARLLNEMLDKNVMRQLSTLPGGAIHADLFRDNALFIDDNLTGIIDFYYAHTGAFIFDLAVLVADWCYAPSLKLEFTKANAIIEGYEKNREISDAERSEWVIALEAAALRFWVSRMSDWYFPRRGEITHTKDPDTLKALLLLLREGSTEFERVLD